MRKSVPYGPPTGFSTGIENTFLGHSGGPVDGAHWLVIGEADTEHVRAGPSDPDHDGIFCDLVVIGAQLANRWAGLEASP